MVVDWCYQVTDHVFADREIVYIAMNILDRFVAVKSEGVPDPSHKRYSFFTDKKSYETAVMTSLFISMKIQQIDSLDLSDLVSMSSSSVTSNDIALTGKDIINSLTWNQQVPTASRFVHAFMALLPDSVPPSIKKLIHETSIEQIETSVRYEDYSKCPPSSVAWMVVENVLDVYSVADNIKSRICDQIFQLGIVCDTSINKVFLQVQERRQLSSKNTEPNVIPLDDEDCVVRSTDSLLDSCHLTLVSCPSMKRNVISYENLTVLSSKTNRQPKRMLDSDQEVKTQHPNLRRIYRTHKL